MIWASKPSIETVNSFSQNCLPGHLGIEITEIGPDFIVGTMPVDHRTKQPLGLLHGGASAALAETLGSFASFLTIKDLNTESVAGLEINANHLRAVKSGIVTGKVVPIRLGRSIHVWDIQIKNADEELVCVSRLTVKVSSKVPKRT